MILVLKGADFSADNLGQVEVTINLHEYTEAAIVASGNNSMTKVQKSALNSLFLAMGVDGSNDVMSKIHRLYLPIIAGDLSKALVNYKDNSFTVDATPTSTYWELRNHGLVGKQQGQDVDITESSPLLANNYCSFLLRTEKMVSGVNDGTYGLILRGKTNTGLFLGLRNESVSSNSGIGFGSYGCNWGVFLNKENDEIKCSFVNYSQTKYTKCVFGNVSSTTSLPAVTSDMSNETQQSLYVFGMSNENTAKPYGVGIIGEALTEEQAITIADKIDKLYEAFNV